MFYGRISFPFFFHFPSRLNSGINKIFIGPKQVFNLLNENLWAGAARTTLKINRFILELRKSNPLITIT